MRGRGRGQQKRRGHDRRPPQREAKRRRPEEEEAVERVSEASESSDEEQPADDPFQQLLGTMNARSVSSVVTDESSSEDEDNDADPDDAEEEADDVHSSESDADDTDEEKGQEEEEGGGEDPFRVHLDGELDGALLAAVSSEKPQVTTTQLSWPHLGRLQVQLPRLETVPASTAAPRVPLGADSRVLLRPAAAPTRPSGASWLHVKQRLRTHAEALLATSGGLSGLQVEALSVLGNYHDLYYAEQTSGNLEELRFVYCLHALNHVLKTRDRVIANNDRVKRAGDIPDDCRDQGLVRPKVLILLPFKDAAYRTINTIISLLLGDGKGTVMNHKRFVDEFTGEELALPKKNPKPEDYELMFRGNVDDNFKIGMSVTKKRLKLYADFYESDIIVASPVGLRVVLSGDGEAEKDFDFLAGLELVVMDQAEVLALQNWEHVLHLWQHLHLQPRNRRDTVFSRIRLSALAGHAKYLCQTCVFSSVQMPEVAALMRAHCRNYAGRVLVANPVHVGSIAQVVVHLPQVFHKIEASSVSQCLEKRFEVFVSKILPQFRDSMMSHTLIYVPSYFDFVRLRKHLIDKEISFVQISEYAENGKIARARDLFFHNEAHFLLYSERFHFFRRIRLKGIRHLVFYQPPTLPHFYPELCNFMQEANQNPRKEGGSATNMTVTVLYSKYDAQRVASIVGTERASSMIASDKSVHLMVTGDDK